MVAAFRRPYPAYRVNAYQASADNPMSEMNTTPLIDVLLVLLIMVIMSVPLAQHKLDVDLPQPTPPDTVIPPAPQISVVIQPQGAVLWDGEAVTRSELQGRLAAAAEMTPAPVIRFRPDPQASYDDAVQVIALIGDAGISKFAFDGNEQFRTFGKD